MGAWIEIVILLIYNCQYYVAPYVGAWIEMISFITYYIFTQSHPMWVRGLKYQIQLHDPQHMMSHPMWVRGLKSIFSVE